MSQECEISGLPAASAALLFSQSSSPLTHANHFHSPNIFAQMSQFLLSLREHQKFRHRPTREEEEEEEPEEEGPFDLSSNANDTLFFFNIQPAV